MISTQDFWKFKDLKKSQFWVGVTKIAIKFFKLDQLTWKILQIKAQWVIHPLGRFSQKTKEKSVQGPPLARMMSLSDKEIKSLAITQEISNVSSSLLT